MIITYVKIYLTMKIILMYERDKESVTYGLCFCRRNHYHLRICHEARFKKCHSIVKHFIISQGAC